ncbi:hypothetical protein HDU97_001441 [Phlyctochytrium planicorne]|nr:hypothetical protein HDU97_001441 [Phlyctochytrium planicorne]
MNRCLNTPGCTNFGYGSDKSCYLKGPDRKLPGVKTIFKANPTIVIDGSFSKRSLPGSFSSEAACLDACKNYKNNGCNYITAFPNGTCKLEPGSVNAAKTALIVAAPEPPQIETCGSTAGKFQRMPFDLYNIGDFKGNFFSDLTACECLAKCRSVQGCTNFVYADIFKTCYLKRPLQTPGYKTIFKANPGFSINGIFSSKSLPGVYKDKDSCLLACDKVENNGCNYITLAPDGTCTLEPGTPSVGNTILVLPGDELPPLPSLPPAVTNRCKTNTIQLMPFDLDSVGDVSDGVSYGKLCDCLDRCRSTPGCTNFVYVGGNDRCVLKKPDTSIPGFQTIFKLNPNVTIEGSFAKDTIPGGFKSKAECIEACQRNNDCNYITVAPDGSCRLEKGKPLTIGNTALILPLAPLDPPISCSKDTSVLFLPFEPNTITDFEGNNQTAKTSCECLDLCRATPGCTNFVFTESKGQCILQKPDLSKGQQTIFKLYPNITLNGGFKKPEPDLKGVYPNKEVCLERCWTWGDQCNYITIAPDGLCTLETGQRSNGKSAIVLPLLPLPPSTLTTLTALPTTTAFSSTSSPSSASSQPGTLRSPKNNVEGSIIPPLRSTITKIGTRIATLTEPDVEETNANIPTSTTKPNVESSLRVLPLPVVIAIGGIVLVSLFVILAAVIVLRRRKNLRDAHIKDTLEQDGQAAAPGEGAGSEQDTQSTSDQASVHPKTGLFGGHWLRTRSSTSSERGLLSPGLGSPKRFDSEKQAMAELDASIAAASTSTPSAGRSTTPPARPKASLWTVDEVSNNLAVAGVSSATIRILKDNNVNGFGLLVLDHPSLAALGFDSLSAQQLLNVINVIRAGEGTRRGLTAEAPPQYS